MPSGQSRFGHFLFILSSALEDMKNRKMRPEINGTGIRSG